MNLFTRSGLALVAGLAVSCIYAGCGTASRSASDNADRSGYADRTMSSLNATDQDFATKAAQGGMAEVEMGNLALQRGANASVKHYGRMLVDDHTRMNNDFKSIASRENITLPTDVSPDQRQTVDRLAKLSGGQFDREFLKTAVKDHRGDISEFEHESADGQDQALQNFAKNNLPTLRKHLEMAEKHGR